VCNLHLHSFSRRHGEIEAANIREVDVFHSSAEQLAKYAKDLPFALVPDPDRKLYKEFGVDTSLRALLDPRVWVFIIAGISHSLFEIVTRKYAVPTLAPEGGRLGGPADLLIATNGTILASKHGEHAYDQWSVDELLCLARSSATTTCDDRDPFVIGDKGT
jgi:AhpC/TSA family